MRMQRTMVVVVVRMIVMGVVVVTVGVMSMGVRMVSATSSFHLAVPWKVMKTRRHE